LPINQNLLEENLLQNRGTNKTRAVISPFLITQRRYEVSFPFIVTPCSLSYI